MSGNGPRRRTVVVANPNGLHMRPATSFAKLAQSLGHRVTVYYGEKQADGVSPTALIMLLAFPGAELVVEVDGPEDAADRLAAVLAAPGDPDDDAD
jgi:phosphotransferase system HPr (HPr) family protein